jgi:hypothetical protein
MKTAAASSTFMPSKTALTKDVTAGFSQKQGFFWSNLFSEATYGR